MSDAFIRPGREDDHAFIFKSWLRSYYEHRADARYIIPQVYYRHQHQVITRILANAAVMVATPAEDEMHNVILAYLVYSPGVAWYAYTKGPFKGKGLQRRLLASAGLDGGFVFNVITPRGMTALEKRFKARKAIYNPYLVSP